MDVINLGETAIGTEINAHPKYRSIAVKELSNITGLPLSSCPNLIDGTKSLRTKAIDGLRINADNCVRSVEQSLAIATLFVGKLGYEKTSDVSKRAQAEGRSLKDILLEEGLISVEKFEEIVNKKI